MVYVLSIEGKPLMPTKRHGKVRRLLKQGLAKVVRVKPFTIQLLKDKVINEFKTMVQMLKDVLTGKYRGIKLSTIGILAFTVVYIILPSLFPQTIVDEAALIMTCIRSLKKEFNRYKAWKLNQI